jgi:hypothetical protein
MPNLSNSPRMRSAAHRGFAWPFHESARHGWSAVDRVAAIVVARRLGIPIDASEAASLA